MQKYWLNKVLFGINICIHPKIDCVQECGLSTNELPLWPSFTDQGQSCVHITWYVLKETETSITKLQHVTVFFPFGSFAKFIYIIDLEWFKINQIHKMRKSLALAPFTSNVRSFQYMPCIYALFNNLVSIQTDAGWHQIP